MRTEIMSGGILPEARMVDGYAKGNLLVYLKVFEKLPEILQKGTPIECVDEIWDAVSDGRLTNAENFDLEAYVRGYRKQDELKRKEKLKTEMYLTEGDEDGKVGYGEVNIDKLSGRSDVEDLAELDSDLLFLREKRIEIFEKHGVDVLICMENAVEGVEAARVVLKETVESDREFGIAFYNALSSYKMDELIQKLTYSNKGVI